MVTAVDGDDDVLLVGLALLLLALASGSLLFLVTRGGVWETRT